MASTFGVFSYFQDDGKLIQRGELALKASHIAAFDYDPEIGACRAKVQASMKDKVYTVELLIDGDGKIVDSSCTCPRGQSKCHHMAAVALFSSQNVSSTSKTCHWSQPKQAKEPAPCVLPDPFKPVDVLSAEKVSRMQEQLQLLEPCKLSMAPTAVAWIMACHWSQPKQAKEPAPCVPPDPFKPVDVLSAEKVSWMQEQLQLLEPCQLSWIAKAGVTEEPSPKYLDVSDCLADDAPSELTPGDIERVERATRGQRLNADWSRARKGRLTASNFGPVLKVANSGRKPSASLMKTLRGGQNVGGAAAVQWGVTHERDAIAMFENHLKVVVQPSGIWLHESGVLGASPDGLVGDDELVEVKCPFSARGGLFSKIEEGNFYVKRDEEAGGDGYYLDASRDPGTAYFHQVQGNIYLTGRKACKLVVWAPGEMIIITVEKDPAWAMNLPKLLSFYNTYMRTVSCASSGSCEVGVGGGRSQVLCVLRK